MATDPDIPTEALEAAAQAIANEFGTKYDVLDMSRPAIENYHRDCARKVLLAAAPHLIAEGRRRAASDIRAVDVERIEHLHGDGTRVGLTAAAIIAERGDG